MITAGFPWMGLGAACVAGEPGVAIPTPPGGSDTALGEEEGGVVDGGGLLDFSLEPSIGQRYVVSAKTMINTATPLPAENSIGLSLKNGILPLAVACPPRNAAPSARPIDMTA